MPITVTIPVLNRKTDGPDVFPVKADAFSAALAIACPEMTTLEENVNQKEVNTVLAANIAQAAAAAAIAASGVTIWVSGTWYTAGQVGYSPISQQSYRRVSPGAGIIDPYYDSDNWTPISSNIETISSSLNGVVWDQSNDSYQVLSGINAIAVIAKKALTALNVETNANLSGDVTSVGNVATIVTTKGVIWDQSNDSYTII